MIKSITSQFLHISSMAIDNYIFAVDRCRKIAKQAEIYSNTLTQNDAISLALKDEWLWIQVRAQVGTINRVDKRANEALEDIRERTQEIVKILAEVKEQ